MLELEILGVHSDGQTGPVVVLRHADRILPIEVDLVQADSIYKGLMGQKLSRPLTHDLITNILVGLRGNLQSITIYKIEEGTFYAHLNIEQRSPDGELQQVLRIDARPSDGLAIATRMKCPIFTTYAVLEEAGHDASVLFSDEDDEPGEDVPPDEDLV